MKITAVINTLNEENSIVDCLESLDWVDEIVVVDMHSDDKTKDLSYKYTKNVFNHKRMGYVEPARNFGIKHATGDWILIIDADERIPRTLAKHLLQVASENRYNFVRIPRQNFIFGKFMEHSRWWPDYNVRFFKKGQVEWQNSIHSIPITKGEGLTLPIQEDLAITHLNYVSVVDYFERFHRYASITARQLIEDGYQFDWTDLVRKPISEFLSRFFAGAGYQDGLHGLVIAILQGFQIFTTYLLVWEKQGFKPQAGKGFLHSLTSLLGKQQREFTYWFTTLQIDLAIKKTAKTLLRLKRKFLPFIS